MSRAVWPTVLEMPRADWLQEAACRTATPAQADALTEATSVEQAGPLVARWCAGCPVMTACLTMGRQSRADGVHGGEVLRRGRVIGISRRDGGAGGTRRAAA